MSELRIPLYLGRTRDNPATRLFDVLVCWVDGTPYSHAELMLSGRYGGADCASSSIRDGGVRAKAIDLTDGHWHVLVVPCEQALAFQRAALQWVRAHAGEPYDWTGLFRTILTRWPERPGHWFCTEAVAAMLGFDDPAVYGPRKLLAWGLARGGCIIDPVSGAAVMEGACR